MKKPLYNVVIFSFHVLTILLLIILCVHFDLIRLSLSRDVKELWIKISHNDYFVNIACTILTAVALYIIQIQYSKHKLKNDFRCNEIIHDVFDGIENTVKLVKNAEPISMEVNELKETPDLDYLGCRKLEAEKYIEFYIKHRVDFELSNLALTYHNNWILIESIQTVFFINLNFKLLSIVNNIKNRKPNLDEEFPKIKQLYEQYEKEKDDKTATDLGQEIRRFLSDIDFMAKYWYDLLNYLGYDPMPIKLYIAIFNAKYPSNEELSAYFKLPIATQNKISRKIQKQATKEYLKYKAKNFFNV